MKKILGVALALTMSSVLFACGSSEIPSAESEASTSTTAAAGGAGNETAAETEANAEENGEGAGDTGAAADGAVWKIGGQGPLTGGAASYGNAVVNGAEVAIKEINEAGGINGYKIEYQKEDDEHDTEKAVNAYNSLKDWGMHFLVGPTTSAPTIAVGAEAEADNTFIITPSGSSEDCTIPKNIFRVCFSDPGQGAKSAQYIGEHKLATKVGCLHDSSDVYSTGIYESFAAEAPNQGIEIVDSEEFTSETNKDFSVQLQKLKDSGAELVFLPFYYTEASLVLVQADSMDYHPIFFGCDGMDGILGVENFNKSLAEGLMLLTPFAADATDDLTVNFVKNYKDAYGEVPIQFAADAYDAVYIIKAAAEKANLNPEMSVSELGDAMEQAMTEINVDGLTGAGMTWDASGNVDKEPKAVVIKDGAYVSAE